MYKDISPLLACAVLPALAIALANDAFENYYSLEEIFNISAPRASTSYVLRIKETILEVPFFQTFDTNGPTGVIEKAMTFSNRLVELGHRAGFASNITMHSARREVLVLADGTYLSVYSNAPDTDRSLAHGYSDTQRKQFAGHRYDIFLPSYALTISTLDSRANASRKAPRPIISDIFCGISLQWFPRIEQSLPAAVQAELAQQNDFARISDKILELNKNLKIEDLKILILTDEIKAKYRC